MSELFEFIKKNDLEKVMELVQNGADIESVKNVHKQIPLSLASHLGHFEIVRYFVQCGVNLNHQDKDGWTALMSASAMRKLKIVQYLVQSGADINIQINIRGDIRWTALMLATYNRDLQIIKYLMQSGADANIKDKHGGTAVDIAKRYKCYRIVQFIEQYPAYLAAIQQLIPKLAPRISLASCARIFEFV